MANSRTSAEQSTTPRNLPAVTPPPQYSVGHSFTLQAIMELQKGYGELSKGVQSIEKTLDKMESKLDTVSTTVDGIRIKTHAASVVLLIFIALVNLF